MFALVVDRHKDFTYSQYFMASSKFLVPCLDVVEHVLGGCSSRSSSIQKLGHKEGVEDVYICVPKGWFQYSE